MGTIPVDRTAAMGFGIMHTDEKRRIVEFVEKPKDPEVLNSLRIPADLLQAIGQPADADLYQASMGIYVFKREVLKECLDNDFPDFGKNIIPAATERYKVQAYIFQGYWEDIGTISAFFKANLNLGDPDPKFNFNEPGAPVYAHPRFLPASIVRSSQIDRSLIADGCTIEKSTIEHSIIGIRSVIDADTVLKDVILMGADEYQADLVKEREDPPYIGIGRGCNIQKAIIDKNARIGDNVVISPGGQGPGNEWRRILHSRRNRRYPKKQCYSVRNSDITARKKTTQENRRIMGGFCISLSWNDFAMRCSTLMANHPADRSTHGPTRGEHDQQGRTLSSKSLSCAGLASALAEAPANARRGPRLALFNNRIRGFSDLPDSAVLKRD